jgi:hypothetical protein
MFYVLDDNNCPVSITMEELIQHHGRHGDHSKTLALDEPVIGIRVSTRFLGMDLSGGSRNQYPTCFETMVFDERRSDIDGHGTRYKTWDQALAGHKEWCQAVIKHAIGDSDD